MPRLNILFAVIVVGFALLATARSIRSGEWETALLVYPCAPGVVAWSRHRDRRRYLTFLGALTGPGA